MNDTETGALTVIGATDLTAIFTKTNGITEILDRIEKEARAIAAKLDVSKPADRRELNSLWKNKVSASRDILIEAGDKLTEGWRAQTAAVKADCKIIETRLNAVRDEIRARVEAFAAIEKSRIAAHEAAIAAIAEHPQWGLTETSEEIAQRLARLKNYPFRDWQEFRERASTILANEIDRTADLLAKAQRREAEAIELARLRAEEIERQRIAALAAQRVREEQIAQAAAESARRDAEAKAKREAAEREETVKRQREVEERKAQAEREAAAKREQDAQAEIVRVEAARKMAEARVEDERRQAAEAVLQAEAKAKRDQEAAVAAERRRIEQQQERDRAEAEQRAANVAHRRRINNEILADLVTAGLPEESAKAVIAAIAKGNIRHVKVEY